MSKIHLKKGLRRAAKSFTGEPGSMKDGFRNPWVLGGGAVIALLAILFILPPPKKVDVERAPVAERVNVVVEHLNREEKDPNYRIDAEYPRIEGLPNKEIEGRVNDELKAYVEKSAAEFHSGLAETRFTAEEKAMQSKLQIRHRIGYMNAHLFSVALETYWDAVGAAHPSADTVTYTYDLRSGRKLALKDLFLPNAEYLQTISEHAIADLEKTLGTEEGIREQIREGAGPVARNYEYFLVAPEGLVIIFNPYQVAPGAGGTQRVVIPYAVLDDITDSAGVLPLRGST